RIEVEPFELAQPTTPAFRAIRGATTLYFHVFSKLDIDDVLDWAQYARTFDTDTRVLVATPDSAPPKSQLIARLATAKVGLLLVGADVQVVLPAADLTINLAIPRLPPGTHEYLGDAWDLLREGKWME